MYFRYLSADKSITQQNTVYHEKAALVTTAV